MSEVSTDKKLKGKDLITIGIFGSVKKFVSLEENDSFLVRITI